MIVTQCCNSFLISVNRLVFYRTQAGFPREVGIAILYMKAILRSGHDIKSGSNSRRKQMILKVCVQLERIVSASR
jgi:hypothetical protein